MLVTRMMLSCRSAASTTASSPATAPVCASAACWPAWLAPDLHRHDRLARLVGPLRRRAERGRVADLLQEQADDPGLLVGDQVVEHVGGRDHRLVAEARDRADADRLRAGERQQRAGQRAALQRDPDRARASAAAARSARTGRPWRGVEEAEAVRPEHDDPVAGRRRDELVLEVPGRRAGLPVTGGEDDRVPHSGGRGVFDHGRDCLGRSEDERQVGGLGQVAQASGPPAGRRSSSCLGCTGSSGPV